jgi:hypothetical protein
MILMQVLCIGNLIELVIVVELFKIHLTQMMGSTFSESHFVVFVEHSKYIE